MRQVLVLYIPALHQSYIKFFEKYKGKVDTLYILDTDITDQFPLAKQELRVMSPQTVLKLLSNQGFFSNIEIADKKMLHNLAADKELRIILSDELISDWLVENYFTGHKVTQEPFFLRYDEKIVKNARREVPFTDTITSEEMHRKLIAEAELVKMKNSEWFLPVGAVLVLSDRKIKSHNIRMPSPHSLWAIGDLRNYLPYGSDTHQRTTLHAEQAVIAHAARAGVKIDGASIYVTTFPCTDCCNNLAEAGINKIYFNDGYSSLSSNDVLEAYKIEVIKVT